MSDDDVDYTTLASRLSVPEIAARLIRAAQERAATQAVDDSRIELVAISVAVDRHTEARAALEYHRLIRQQHYQQQLAASTETPDFDCEIELWQLAVQAAGVASCS